MSGILLILQTRKIGHREGLTQAVGGLTQELMLLITIILMPGMEEVLNEHSFNEGIHTAASLWKVFSLHLYLGPFFKSQLK